MRILLLHENQPCYLTESLFHGLRTVMGEDCVDVPRMSSMYAPLNHGVRAKLRGHGFTLYGLLKDSEELEARRYAWRLELEKYDFIILPHIWWQGYLLKNLLDNIPHSKIIVLDGEDSPRIFPFRQSIIWKKIEFIQTIFKIKYFKREAVGGGECVGIDKVLPLGIAKLLSLPKRVYSLPFSIPQEKIYQGEARKEKLFSSHIVDNEVAAMLGKQNGSQYQFQTEEDYYQDLRSSKFGVTTKRAGWDCLRHYELAANGCVPCFKNLHLKSPTCAPLGLNESNSISYTSASDLMEKVNGVSDEEYARLRENTINWAKENSTENRARQFLETIGK